MNHEHEHEGAASKLIHLLNDEITPVHLGDTQWIKNLMERIGDSRLVLMGEASHGTQEFYQARVELSQYLIEHENFHAVTIEGDWTSAYPVQQYIQGFGDADDALSALEDFKRFPKWMWRNETFLPFVRWLRTYNDRLTSQPQKVSFYGLDLYCLHDAMQAVLNYLRANDPEEAKRAEERYACFDHASVDPQKYGYLVDMKYKKACIQESTDQLLEMQTIAFNKLHNRHMSEDEAMFFATQNARLVKNAEHYYRALFQSHEITWNIRDHHMGETLQNIMTHLETKMNVPAKIIVWAHNSHLGDSRATEMSERKEINLGQIVREHFSMSSFHIGFSTYTGTVTAADHWDGPAKTKNVVPGMPGSYEALFHELSERNFILYLHGNEHLLHLLQTPRLQRAIGVIYLPHSERYSHYFFTKLPLQFDAIIHFDDSRAVKPIFLN